MTKGQKIFSALGRFFKNIFTKNIPLKIIALVFALLLWGYVLSEVKPRYVKRVPDVEIELQNEDRLRAKGWVVANQDVLVTDVSVEAGIDKHSMIDASRINCYVDLDRIPLSAQDPNQKTVQVDVSTTIPEYAVLKSVSVEQVALTIERTQESKVLTVTVQTVNSLPVIETEAGAPPEYFECIAPESVTIGPLSGLKSDLDRISRAEAKIDLSSFESVDPADIPRTYSPTVPVEFYDAAGELIDSTSTADVKATIENVKIRRYKEVPIDLNVIFADTAESSLYECKYDFADGSNQVVRIYGDAAELAKVDSIKTERVIPNLTEGEETLTVGLLVPAGVNTDRKETVTISLKIQKRMAEDTILEVPIVYSRLDNGLVLAEKPESIRIRVSGLVEAMNLFNANWITAAVDLSNCGAGTLELPVTITFRGTNLEIENYSVQEPDDGAEAVIRITFVSKNGMVYQIELPQKTVTVKLQTVEAGS